jgi:hypothetical protein
LTFAHNALVRLVAAPHPVFKLAIAFRHFLGDDVRSSGKFELRAASTKTVSPILNL